LVFIQIRVLSLLVVSGLKLSKGGVGVVGSVPDAKKGGRFPVRLLAKIR